MKIPPKQHLKAKIILTFCGIVVILVSSWFIFAYHHELWPFQPQSDSVNPSNTVNYDQPTTEQTEAGKSIKEQVADQAKDDDGSTAPTTSTVTLDITAANKTSDMLLVRTLIQTISSSGTCSLTMTGPGKMTYTATSAIQPNASSSTCQGFNIPLSNLGQGTWSITINFQGDGISGSATKEVTI